MLSADDTATRGPRSRAAMLSALRFLRTLAGVATLATVALLLCGASPAFAQVADLTVSKSGPATTAANSDIVYSITATNLGPDPASSTTLTDAVPAGTTFVGFAQNTGPSFSCSTPSGGMGTVSCSLASFAAGATATFTLTVHVPTGTAPARLSLTS
jgi:uncharacterized repeat protein (TIGR01451 family)